MVVRAAISGGLCCEEGYGIYGSLVARAMATVYYILGKPSPRSDFKRRVDRADLDFQVLRITLPNLPQAAAASCRQVRASSLSHDRLSKRHLFQLAPSGNMPYAGTLKHALCRHAIRRNAPPYGPLAMNCSILRHCRRTTVP